MSRRILISLAILMSANFAFAGKDFHVFEIRKNLQLSENEPVYHDYYINAGVDQGLKPGMLIQVSRRLPVHDSLGVETHEDMIIHVATIKLIHVQREVSIGRLAQIRSSAKIPLVDFDAVMAGDRVDISTASMQGEEGAGSGQKGDGTGSEKSEEKGGGSKQSGGTAPSNNASQPAKAPEMTVVAAVKTPEKAKPDTAASDKPKDVRSPDSAKSKLDPKGPAILTN